MFSYFCNSCKKCINDFGIDKFVTVVSGIILIAVLFCIALL